MEKFFADKFFLYVNLFSKRENSLGKVPWDHVDFLQCDFKIIFEFYFFHSEPGFSYTCMYFIACQKRPDRLIFHPLNRLPAFLCNSKEVFVVIGTTSFICISNLAKYFFKMSVYHQNHPRKDFVFKNVHGSLYFSVYWMTTSLTSSKMKITVFLGNEGKSVEPQNIITK